MFQGPPPAQMIDGSGLDGDDGFRGIAVRFKISNRDSLADAPPVAFNERSQLARKASRLTTRSKQVISPRGTRHANPSNATYGQPRSHLPVGIPDRLSG